MGTISQPARGETSPCFQSSQNPAVLNKPRLENGADHLSRAVPKAHFHLENKPISAYF